MSCPDRKATASTRYPIAPLNWSLITASNNDSVLQSCLARSPCVSRATDFQVMRGFASAGAAYNAGIRHSTGDILVFAHQDVYLPDGWEDCLAQAITRLSALDPDWAVLGVWGITVEAKPAGYSYCTGLQKVLGRPFEKPIPCISLDEALVVLRRSAELCFDEKLPAFHLYGTDICLAARQRGMKSYLISAFCIHNTAGLTALPWAFWPAYFYMRHKWWRRLPVMTPCSKVERWPFSLLKQTLVNWYLHQIKRNEVGQRVSDPQGLYQQLLQAGKVAIPERGETCPLAPKSRRAEDNLV
ncbi:MAG TPA: hypothetical protein VG146_13945 [Verrucomicrobiae bacterium]|nr:hypothetical protein [Verrucomicrobiae bacterium]